LIWYGLCWFVVSTQRICWKYYSVHRLLSNCWIEMSTHSHSSQLWTTSFCV
jgi:hypothetical protein